MPNDFNCPLEKGYRPLGSACYKISTDTLSYDQAHAACQADKGSFKYGGLATIWDTHDQGFLYSIMNEGSPAGKDSHWIGLHFDKELTGSQTGTKWLWEDKHALTYTKPELENDIQNGNNIGRHRKINFLFIQK